MKPDLTSETYNDDNSAFQEPLKQQWTHGLQLLWG